MSASVTLSEVAKHLEAAGISATLDPPGNACVVGFDIDGRRQPCVVIMTEPQDYFVLLSPASKPVQIDELSATTLRALVLDASKIRLAKLEYAGEQTHAPGYFFASSECSVDGYTTEKLRRRMEACARLAVRVDAVLQEGVATVAR